jgi:SHS2 domain-containing protein
MSSKFYRLIEHTADIGIKVRGVNQRQLFANAARAMFDIMAGKKKAGRASLKTPVTIRLDAANVEVLFHDWLNELVSLAAVKYVIFCDFKFKTLTAERLEAIAFGCDAGAYAMRTEIKAVTYHQLRVRKIRSGWSAEVIFDV